MLETYKHHATYWLNLAKKHASNMLKHFINVLNHVRNMIKLASKELNCARNSSISINLLSGQVFQTSHLISRRWYIFIISGLSQDNIKVCLDEHFHLVIVQSKITGKSESVSLSSIKSHCCQ